MDCEKKFKKIVSGTKKFFQKTGFEKAVFGLSGGLDSSVLGFVLQKALGGKNVFALHMPTDLNGSRKEVKDSLKIAGLTKINLSVFTIGKACEKLYNTVWKPSKLAMGNIQARARMIVLYSFSNTKHALVVGAGNRSELALGYFTKFGDAGCDLLPLGSLFKTEVKELAEWLNVPKTIIEKKPSAGLYEEQTDERELGLKYKEIDPILSAYLDKGKKEQELKKEFDSKAVDRVLFLMKQNAHKKETPFVVKA